ncbi:histidine kinase [Nocardioides sp. TRM66260-LWL]|uniref:sensor histidine kinase n=1 Tax=Nocardioides sp. TRM66260-LWL TaxID=2874478 RepID=UPI001CC65819|nr:histidine kinase [Nocardioides sp. TRM66260-LWL]MBZ5733083.1 histidine kinase [Nocardioides sp. TRM66260-LWL]
MAGPDTTPLPARRGIPLLSAWQRMEQPERVDAYTRWTLLAIVWGGPLVVLLETAPFVRDQPRGLVASVFGVGVALTALAHRVVEQALAVTRGGAGRPDVRPLLLGCGLASTGAATLSVELRGPALAMIVAALSWGLGALRTDRVTLALLAVVAALGVAVGRERSLLVLGLLVCAALLATVQGSLWFVEVVHELDRARRARVALVLAEERLRFGRDVHDVVGRRLSAIALHADLAERLLGRDDPDGSRAALVDIRAMAHAALAEARELARGYRPASLEQEVDGARSLLGAAGIALTARLDGLADAHREPAAWVVREAVTNVLRHSRATRVRIVHDAGVLAVDDDGGPTQHALDRDPAGGTGLAQLSDRLAGVGGRLATHADDAGFHVRADLTRVVAPALRGPGREPARESAGGTV